VISRKALNHLYFGATRTAIRFQASMLVLDVALIAFFMASPFLEHGRWFLITEYVIAALLAVDLATRAWAYGNFRKWIMRPIVLADIAVLISVAVPALGGALGFIRILRAYSLVNGHAFWRIIGGGRWQDTQVAETARAVVNLIVFVFMMTGMVHALFAGRVPALKSYMDSLYFTVTSLTTTGYGDIVLPGFWGRVISIAMMIGGVSLFFRLVAVTMRPVKVRHTCPECGLMRHEVDAVHCKACGTRVNIQDDNE
jgi:voltage-gated potassium channel